MELKLRWIVLCAVLSAGMAAGGAFAQDLDLEADLFGTDASDSPAEGASGAPEAAAAGEGADPEALFDFPDTAGFDASGAPADEVRTEYLVGGTVVLSGYLTGNAGKTEYAAGANSAGKIFAKVSVPDYGALYAAYNVSHTLFQGYGADSPLPGLTAVDLYTPKYELSEFHYSFDIAKRLFVRLGNQLTAWGPSRIWTPVDFINLEKNDAFAALDSRRGKPGLRMHAPLPRGNIFVFFDFASLSSNSRAALMDPADKTNIGARGDFTAGAFEFGVSGYGGAETQVRLGLDISGRLLGTTVYMEAAAAPEYDKYGSYAQIAAGFSRTLGELKNWTFSAETFYNSKPQANVPLYQGLWYAYLSLAADELLDPGLSSAVSFLANLEDQSYQVKFTETVGLPRAVPFSVGIGYFGGGEGKEFTRRGGNQGLSLSVSTRIEF